MERAAGSDLKKFRSSYASLGQQLCSFRSENTTMRKLILRLRKLAFCAFRPSLWRFLLKGVAPTIDHVKPLGSLNVSMVLDVGANRGQFALMARKMWPKSDIICFEPLPEPSRLLTELFSGSNVKVLQTALSDKAGVMQMYVTESDDSSSLLQIGINQQRISHTIVNHVENAVAVDTLDNVLADVSIPEGALLKIDVQGTEENVLRGASASLAKLTWVYVECSYIELYIGQSLASGIVLLMDQNGFELSGVFNQAFDRKIGAVQADFLFTRRIARLNKN